MLENLTKNVSNKKLKVFEACKQFVDKFVPIAELASQIKEQEDYEDKLRIIEENEELASLVLSNSGNWMTWLVDPYPKTQNLQKLTVDDKSKNP